MTWLGHLGLPNVAHLHLLLLTKTQRLQVPSNASKLSGEHFINESKRTAVNHCNLFQSFKIRWFCSSLYETVQLLLKPLWAECVKWLHLPPQSPPPIYYSTQRRLKVCIVIATLRPCMQAVCVWGRGRERACPAETQLCLQLAGGMEWWLLVRQH